MAAQERGAANLQILKGNSILRESDGVFAARENNGAIAITGSDKKGY